MMNLVLGGIAGISFLVGGIGIMNIAGNGARTDQEDQRPAGYRRAQGLYHGAVPSGSCCAVRRRGHYWNRAWSAWGFDCGKAAAENATISKHRTGSWGIPVLSIARDWTRDVPGGKGFGVDTCRGASVGIELSLTWLKAQRLIIYTFPRSIWKGTR